MKVFNVWVEGYCATGNSGKAWKKGSIQAETFKEACDLIFKKDRNYDKRYGTWWGCRLFEEEYEARREFG